MTREKVIRLLSITKDSMEEVAAVSGYDGALDHDIEALDAALAALREQERRWILVTERMPEDFVSVLVHIPSEAPLPTVHEAYWAGEVWMTREGGFIDSEITHWMPMPESPQEDA